MIQLALVGGAHIHTPAFIKTLKSRPEFAVKWVWDHDPARASKSANELGAKVVPDAGHIWADDSIKAVIICSETNRHEELVIPAAAARKHLFVEKPLGLGSSDAGRMARAIEAAKVMFHTGYFMRGIPEMRFLRDQISAGHFGTIHRLRGSTCHRGALAGWFDTEWRWMADPKQAGCGAYGDLGTHSLDLLLWLMNETPVQSCIATISNGTRRYGDCDELGEGLLQMSDGAIATLSAGWDDLANPLSLLISGTEANAAIMNDQLYFMCNKVSGANGTQPWTQLPEPIKAGFDAFLDALEGKPAALVPVKEAAYRNSVMEALYESTRSGQWTVPGNTPQ
ncbi:MAG: Gfo/Idh/MocA family oxidoreductase [Phycisphaerales bacterium]|jgi:predicted dehydrogenase|nr:Gfo/Idh/MocA family oxidoreductase [Phycisphaerales bacterium]